MYTRLPVLGLMVVTGIALALRLLGLDRKSVWFDEAVSAGFAVLSVPQLMAASAGDVNPPLYYLLLHFWWPLVGDDFALRLPSALCSAAAVAMTVLLGRQLLNWTSGLLAGACTALSTFHIDLGQEARGYGLLSLLTVLSLWLLLRALQRGSARAYLLFALASTLVIYTHNYGLLVVLAEGCYVLVAMAVRRRLEWRAIGAFVLVGILFIPWLPRVFGQVGLIGGDYWIEHPGSGVLWDTYYAFIAYSSPTHGWSADPLSRLARWALLAILGLSVVAAWRQPQLLLVLLGLGVPLATALALSVLSTPIYAVRYVGFLAPLFWLLVASGVDLLPAALLRGPIAVAVFAFLLPNLSPLYSDPFYSRSDVRSAAAAVRGAAAPGDLVVHTEIFTHYPFAYYDHDTLEEVLLPDGDTDALQTAAGDRARFWYVRQFGLADPTAAASADAAAHSYLREWTILQQHEYLGAHLYLVRGPHG